MLETYRSRYIDIRGDTSIYARDISISIYRYKSLNHTQLVHTGLDLRVNIFDKNEPHAAGREQHEKNEKRGKEEKSELRILILLRASPLFRCLGKRHRLK
jgi:hypothetical protein